MKRKEKEETETLEIERMQILRIKHAGDKPKRRVVGSLHRYIEIWRVDHTVTFTFRERQYSKKSKRKTMNADQIIFGRGCASELVGKSLAEGFNARTLYVGEDLMIGPMAREAARLRRDKE